jgi:rhodanese-related sulfurtransferase
MSAMVEMPRKDVPPPLELVKGRIEELLPPEARGRIEAGGAVLIDTRDAERFELGHLEGAVSIPSGASGWDARADEYATAVDQAAGGRERELILYCGEGNRSARTVDALRNEHGFANAVSIIGGLKLWSDLGYPIEGELAAGADDDEVAVGGDDDEDGEG